MEYTGSIDISEEAYKITATIGNHSDVHDIRSTIAVIRKALVGSGFIQNETGKKVLVNAMQQVAGRSQKVVDSNAPSSYASARAVTKEHTDLLVELMPHLVDSILYTYSEHRLSHSTKSDGETASEGMVTIHVANNKQAFIEAHCNTFRHANLDSAFLAKAIATLFDDAFAAIIESRGNNSNMTVQEIEAVAAQMVVESIDELVTGLKLSEDEMAALKDVVKFSALSYMELLSDASRHDGVVRQLAILADEPAYKERPAPVAYAESEERMEEAIEESKQKASHPCDWLNPFKYRCDIL